MEALEEIVQTSCVEAVHAGSYIAAADEDEVGHGEDTAGCFHIGSSGGKCDEGYGSGAGITEYGGKLPEETLVVVAGDADVGNGWGVL